MKKTKRFQALFFRYVAIILLLTAVAKLYSIRSETPVLAADDPLFGVSFRYILCGAAFLEIAIALGCMILRSESTKAVMVIWLSSMFIIYRFGLIWVGYVAPCKCLGTLTQALHIQPEFADSILKGVVAIMFAGGLAVLAGDKFKPTEKLVKA